MKKLLLLTAILSLVSRAVAVPPVVDFYNDSGTTVRALLYDANYNALSDIVMNPTTDTSLECGTPIGFINVVEPDTLALLLEIAIPDQSHNWELRFYAPWSWDLYDLGTAVPTLNGYSVNIVGSVQFEPGTEGYFAPPFTGYYGENGFSTAMFGAGTFAATAYYTPSEGTTFDGQRWDNWNPDWYNYANPTWWSFPNGVLWQGSVQPAPGQSASYWFPGGQSAMFTSIYPYDLVPWYTPWGDVTTPLSSALEINPDSDISWTQTNPDTSFRSGDALLQLSGTTLTFYYSDLSTTYAVMRKDKITDPSWSFAASFSPGVNQIGLTQYLGYFEAIDAMVDSDGDGVPDWWELRFGLDVLNPSDSGGDPDHDGVSIAQDYQNRAAAVSASLKLWTYNLNQ